MKDPSLDEDLKSTLQTAADSLEATQRAAQSALEAIAKEMKLLRADNDRSKEAEKILQKYRNGMENNGMATQWDSIDKFENRHAFLIDLINYIPTNDPKLEKLRALLNRLLDNDAERNRILNEIMKQQSLSGDLIFQANLGSIARARLEMNDLSEKIRKFETNSDGIDQHVIRLKVQLEEEQGETERVTNINSDLQRNIDRLKTELAASHLKNRKLDAELSEREIEMANLEKEQSYNH